MQPIQSIPLKNDFALQKGCRVYYRKWANGYLYVSEITPDNHLALKDEMGHLLFTNTYAGDVYHVGDTHQLCKKEV